MESRPPSTLASRSSRHLILHHSTPTSTRLPSPFLHRQVLHGSPKPTGTLFFGNGPDGHGISIGLVHHVVSAPRPSPSQYCHQLDFRSCMRVCIVVFVHWARADTQSMPSSTYDCRWLSFSLLSWIFLLFILAWTGIRIALDWVLAGMLEFMIFGGSSWMGRSA